MSHPYRRRRRQHAQAEAVQSAIWLIGLGVLFLTGWWWPGILILVGLSSVLGAVAESAFPTAPEPERPPKPERPPAAAPLPTPFEVAPTPTPPAAPARAVRLPDLCPQCGAPPRTLRSLNPDNPFECPYCGSDLKAISAK